MEKIQKMPTIRNQVEDMAVGQTMAVHVTTATGGYLRQLTSMLSFELQRKYSCNIDRPNNQYIITRHA